MIEATIIGTILNSPKEIRLNGKPAIEFYVRCENSPKDKEGTTSDFKVMTTNLGLRDRLQVDSEIYVSGMLRLSVVKGRVQADLHGLVFNLLDRKRSLDDIKMEILTQSIPLQSI